MDAAKVSEAMNWGDGWLVCCLFLFCVIVYKLGTLLGTRLGTLLGTLDFVVFIDFFLLVGTMELINRVK